MSDRTDLWLPDGTELESAYQKNLCKFSPRQVLDLMEVGIVRVAGREINFEKGNRMALNASGSTEFDEEVCSLYRQGKVCLHKNYPGAKIAYREISHFIYEIKKKRRPH